MSFRTTCSIWLEKSIDEPCNTTSPGLDIILHFLEEDKSQIIDWLKKHHASFPWMYFRREIDAAQTNGHIYACILHRQDIIGYIKVGINHTYIHDFNRVVRFPPKVAFIYDTFILPEYRGRHVATHTIIRTLQFLKERHFEKTWCHIEEWNHASLKIFRKIGFKERASIRFCRLFGFPFFVQDGYKPFINLETFINHGTPRQ